MRHRRLLRSQALLACALALVPSPSTAQAEPSATGAGVSYETYWFRDPEATNLRSISLVTVPVAGRASIGRILDVEIAGAFARGVLVREDGSEAVMSGLTDAVMRLRVPLVRDRLVVSGLVVLPVGTEAPDREQVEVAGAIASDLLPLQISNWGSGGGVGIGATGTHSFGPTGVGVGVSYLVSREFEPLADAGLARYRPGDQLALQVVVDRNIGRTGKASLRGSYQHQSDDRLQGDNLFRSGDRFQAIGSYAFRVARRSSGIVYLGGQRRERGTALLDLTRGTPSQLLLLTGGGLRAPLAGGVATPSADLRLLRSADGVGQGYLASFGTGFEWPLGRLTATPRVRAQIGRLLVRSGAESNVVGLELGLGVRY